MFGLPVILLGLGFGMAALVYVGRRCRKPSQPRLSPVFKALDLSLAIGLAFLMFLGLGAGLLQISLVRAQAETLSVEILAGYNLVVDSNVESPSTYAPSVATVGARFCNTGPNTLTDVSGYIGNFVDGVNDTPGLYPARNSNTDPLFKVQHPRLADTGSYAFTHVGGSIGQRDASRYIGDLAAGECRVVYWHFTYPRRANPDNSGAPVWGESSVPGDDLWLEFDVWATGQEAGLGSLVTDATWKMTMRNEISAMANKIQPQGGVWFNTNTSIVKPGDLITSNGVRYELGNINKGFDNDGDGSYDYNAWLQPIGDPAYDPSCFRLIRTSGVLTVSRSAGPNLIIPFTDQLYFTDLPSNNTGAVGNVYYTFMALGGPCNSSLTPYQEVASGADNEKFNGDYGVGLPPVASSEPDLALDKTGNVTVTVGSTIDYEVPAANTGTSGIGLPLISGGSDGLPWMPLVFSDTIPAGTVYVKGSAGHTFTGADAVILYSTDNGQTWTKTEPENGADVTHLQWWLTDTLLPGESGSVVFRVTVPGAPTNGYIENCAEAGLGDGPPLAEACTVTLVQGNNYIGDTVWQDENGNGLVDTGEAGISGISVNLYLDINGDGLVDSGDRHLITATTSITGYYSFGQLPNASFIVTVDRDDPDLPAGYGLTTDDLYAVTLNNNNYLEADFGFGPSLAVSKGIINPPAMEGRPVVYTIDVTNLLPGNGTGQPSPCSYYVWAGTANLSTDVPASGSGNSAWQLPANALGAPDQSSAYTELANNPDKLGLSGFNLRPREGNITSVEMVVHVQEKANLKDNDKMELTLYLNNASRSPIFSYSGLTNFSGPAGTSYIFREDITGYAAWDWSFFSNNYTELLVAGDKGNENPPGDLYLDAAGFIVTTDQLCGDSGTINPVPLSDTYNANLLQFVSAEPPVSSVTTGGGGPYANTGTLAWNNVGPLYAGQTKTIEVTFLALEPPGNLAATVVNTATVAGARFVTGGPATDDSDDVSATLQPAARIGDRVWNDLDGDGVQDAGEPGLAGVTVRLCTSTGGANPACDTELATTTTGADGSYIFEGLANGTYLVEVMTASLPGTTFTNTYDRDGSKNSRTTITINNLADNLLADFGYQVPNTIFGSVWEDNDGDSAWDSGENGFGGVTVYLDNCGANGLCGDGDDGPSLSTLTDASGTYTFSDLADGNYRVRVDTSTLPAGVTWSQTVDPDATADSRTNVIPASGGNIYGAYDFAYTGSGSLSLGDSVYVDWNGNGSQDSGEEGLPGITVSLYEDSNGDGIIDPAVDALVRTTVTGISGAYSFDNLAPGDYIVVVDTADPEFPFAENRYRQTQDYDGLVDNQAAVGLVGNLDSVDFGYQPLGPGSIGDLVWQDNDGDGLRDVGEPGIGGILVALYEDTDGNGALDPAVDALVGQATTDSGGAYLFTNLPAGNYLVDVDTADLDLPLDGYGKPYVLSSHNDPLPVGLGEGQAYLLADFGFTTGGVIGDLVWRDDNQDGDPAGEPGIAGATVRLYVDNDGDGLLSVGDTPVATTTTNASGVYTFTGLGAETYVVVLDMSTTPASALTYDPDGTLDGQTQVVLGPRQTFLGADFGLPNTNGAIGDRLWIDVDQNDTYEPYEPGLGGITVTLTIGSGAVFTTVTDNDGYYLFPDLVQGVYTITIEAADLPVGLTPSFEVDGSLDQQVVVNLAGGENNLTVDFGYRQQAGSIGDFIWHDSNANGIQETGEPGLDGVTVQLYSSGGALISTTVTVNGLYTFTDVISGSYYIQVSPPTGYVFTAPDQGGNDSLDSDPDGDGRTPIFVVNAGDKITRIDAGLYPSTDVSVTKTADRAVVVVGEVLTYTLEYGNSGPAEAQAVVITETLPAEVSFGGIVSTNPVLAASTINGQQLVWDIGSLGSGASGTIVLTVTVDSAGSGTMTNSVEIATSTAESDPANNQAEVETTVEDADVSIVKTADRAVVVVGEVLTYTLEYGNAGPAGAQAVVITETLPAEVSFGGVVSTNPVLAAPTINGQRLVWDIGSLGSGAAGTIVLTVTVDSTGSGTMTNSVEIGTSTAESDPANNQAEVETTVQDADVSIVKTADRSVVVVGEVLTYTLEYGNSGPAGAQAVVITETLPAEVSFGGIVSQPASASGPVVNGRTLVWNIGSLGSGAVGTIVLTVTVDSTGSGLITNSVEIGTSTAESDPANNQAEVETTVEDADVYVTKTADRSVVVVGEVLTYTLEYGNAGPAEAQAVVITETLPAEVTYGGIVSTNPLLAAPDVNGRTLVWNIGSLSSGAVGTIVLTVTVDSTGSGTMTNSVEIATATAESDPANNQAEVETTVEDADVSIVKTADRPVVVVGEVLTYTLEYGNAGPAAAQAVVITETLPAEVTYGGIVSTNPVLAAPTISGQRLVWDIGSLSSGAAGTIVLTVTVDSTGSGTMTNSVEIATSTAESDPANNQAEVETTVEDADVSIVKTADRPVVVVGEVLTYTLEYGNAGPAAAQAVVITETLPAEVSFGGIVSTNPVLAAPTISGQRLVWDIGSLGSGAAGTIVLTVTVDSTGSGTMTNSVEIGTSTAESDPANNRDEVETTVEDADVYVTKTADRAVAVVGEALTYTLEYGNAGPAEAQAVVITETLPAEVSFGGVVSTNPTLAAPTISGQRLVWDIGSLGSGAVGTIVLTVTVDSTGSGLITNSVEIATSTAESDPANNRDEAETTVQDADVYVTKTADRSVVVVGETLTYTLEYGNAGPAEAQAVVITETLPAEVTYGGIVSTNPVLAAPTINGQTLTWAVGSLGSGAVGTIVLTATVDSTGSGTMTNSVEIGTSTAESNPANNQAEVETEVLWPGLAVTKTLLTGSPVAAGDPVAFRLVVANTGNTDLVTVPLTDSYDTGYLAYTGANPASDDNSNDGTINWANVGPVAAGDSVTIIVNFTAVASTQGLAGRSTVNMVLASATDETGHAVPADMDTDVVQIVRPGLTVEKLVGLARIVPNQEVTYTIRVANTGDIALTTVTITDTLPPGFVYVPNSGHPLPDSTAAGRLVWFDATNGLGLNPGQQAQVTFRVTVPDHVGTYVNHALVEGRHPGGVLTETDTVSTIVADPSVELSKGVMAPGVQNGVVTFTLQITNTGPSSLDQLPLIDRFSGPAVYLGGTPPASRVDNVNQVIAWDDLTLPAPHGFGRNLGPGETFVVTTVYQVTGSAGSFSMTNVATVTNAIDIYHNPASDDSATEVLTNVPTAVELLYFRGVRQGDQVTLSWATAVELDNFGFRVLRSTSGDLGDAVEIAFISGQGQGIAGGASYSFTDPAAMADQIYTYWLVDVDLAGIETVYSVPVVVAGVRLNTGPGTVLYLPLITRD